MHATRDTNDVINLDLAGGRVMRGVRLLLRYNPLLIECVALADGAGVCLKRGKPSCSA
jgi:hypothetical protein